MNVNMHKMLNTTGKAFHAPWRRRQIINNITDTVNHHFFQVSLNDILIRHGYRRKAFRSTRHLIGRKDYTVQTAGTADIHLMALWNKIRRVRNRPMAARRRGILQAYMKRPGKCRSRNIKFRTVRTHSGNRDLSRTYFIFINHEKTSTNLTNTRQKFSARRRQHSLCADFRYHCHKTFVRRRHFTDNGGIS